MIAFWFWIGVAVVGIVVVGTIIARVMDVRRNRSIAAFYRQRAERET